MATLGPEIFSRGFRFNPTPLEAATYYLPRLVAGAPLHEAVRPVVHRAQVYASEPGDLARMFPPLPKTGHRFFFTHCKLQHSQKAGKAIRAARAAGAGSWHSQSVSDVVDGAGAKVGEVRKLRYKKAGAYTDWLMDEFSSTLCSQDAIVAGDRQYVLCNIYVSPRAAPDSAARQESAAFFAPPAATKRPAPPQVAEPPCPKRMRGAVAPAPPAMQPASYCTKPFVPPPPYATASAPPPPPLSTRLAAPPPQLPTRFAASPPQLPTSFAAPPLNRPPAPAPPQPKQQIPPPTLPLPVVRACHVPVAQAPAPQCQPQAPSEKTKQRTLDPFEAAELRYEAEEDERVAAPSADPEEPPAVALDEDDVWDELASLLATQPASKESPAAAAAQEDFDVYEFCNVLEDIIPTI
ncbi:unnamed protein product [Urochloa humidicola]